MMSPLASSVRLSPALRAPRGLAALLVVSCVAIASSASAQLFRRPVECDSCISDYYYYDHGGRDWSCGRSTYGDHRGSDFSLRNGNFAISQGNVVVAMADGVVRHSEDGYYDQCTQCGGFNCGQSIGYGFANQVHIDHGDYTVVYGHMRMGSIMVNTGDRVTCGQVIGQIGSSGCSTGAHLHVEPRPLGRDYLTAFDPFEGDCSPLESSLWVEQGSPRTLPSTACDDGAPRCPADTYEIWTCLEDLSARRRCIAGEDVTEPCAYGCVVMPVGTDDVCAMPPDADGDGARADVDCDDEDASIHPGAVDTCGDGVDQDCSTTDEQCASADVDLDGATADVDCDDGDASIHPGAVEICGDGIDQDCDRVDAPCGGAGLDADGDGSPAPLDCNDGNASIHPGAVEICGDGVDQDCDRLDVVCGAGAAGASAAGVGGVAPVGSTASPISAGPRAGSEAAGCDCRIGRAPRGASGTAGWLLVAALAAGFASRRRRTRGWRHRGRSGFFH